MNTKQHISNRIGRVCRVLLPGGFLHLGSLFAEWCNAEPVAVRATKRPAMLCRDFNRSSRKA